MTLQNSPGFEHVAVDETLEQAPQKENRGGFWGIVAVLVLILLALMFVNYWGDTAFASIRGKGAVSGFVVDEEGNAVKAEILVAGTELQTMTDEAGRFQLNDIPEGQRLLVVGYDLMGWEYPVTVIAGQTLDLGKISVVTTITP
ncbi:MAG: carboxypeptidase-like regulatory domain-containing protein [Anaerolineaceae bacterium]|nr:carboxypeptidase-like regulatory domain-containing protein [Anaerolineaceae bacterium]